MDYLDYRAICHFSLPFQCSSTFGSGIESRVAWNDDKVSESTSVSYARTHRDAEEPHAGQLYSSMIVLPAAPSELDSESEASSLSA